MPRPAVREGREIARTSVELQGFAGGPRHSGRPIHLKPPPREDFEAPDHADARRGEPGGEADPDAQTLHADPKGQRFFVDASRPLMIEKTPEPEE